MRRLFIAFTLIILFGQVKIASAREILQGDACTVAADTTITGDVFVACQQIIIDGTVTGSVFGTALTGRINGTVEKNLYLLMWQLEINGSIGGDVHFAGASVRLQPETRLGGSVVSASLSTQLEDIAVPGSITGIGYQLLQDGQVGEEINFWGTALTVDGTVNGDVTASVGDRNSTGVRELRTLFNALFRIDLIDPGLRVTENAAINGVLSYESVSEGEIAGQLATPPVFTPVVVALDLDGQGDIGQSIAVYLNAVLREFIGLGLIGLLTLLFVPIVLLDPIYSLRTRPLPSLGVGLVTFIAAFPIGIFAALIGLLLFFVFALLGLVDLGLGFGLVIEVITLAGVGLFVFVAIYITRVIVALALGRLLLRVLLGERVEGRMNVVALLIGVVLLALLVSLPIIGVLINALAVFLGLGAILTLVQRELDQVRQQSPPRPRGGDYIQIPPPILEEDLSAPGMANLPDGFKWWE
ncbi:MAG: polymer-forming cytoskeletal protein [Anaerolinea sp.]|nr:polymer-forming cytoskeletal protein [Anaerolinea sp.]